MRILQNHGEALSDIWHTLCTVSEAYNVTILPPPIEKQQAYIAELWQMLGWHNVVDYSQVIEALQWPIVVRP